MGSTDTIEGNYGSVEVGVEVIKSDDAAAHQRLWVLVIVLCFGVLAEGYDFGVLNGALVRIQESFGLTSMEVAMIVTATPLFIIPGSLLGGLLADAKGRRPALMVTLLVLTIGPLLMALSINYATLVIGRAIVGLGIGFGYVVISMYIAEIAPSELRGRFIAFEDVALNIGMLLGYTANWSLLGMQDDWRYMLGFGSLLTFVLVGYVMLGMLPESPRWLLVHDRQNEALAVMTRYVGAQEAQETLRSWKDAPVGGVAPWSQLLSTENGPTRRTLMIGAIVGASQTLCGYLAVAYYSSKTMKRLMDAKSAFLNTMIMGAIKTVVVLGVVAILDRVGRRCSLLVSTAVTTCGCIWVSIAFACQANAWLLAAGFWIFMAGFSLGLGPVMFVYLAEVFPTELRGKAMGFTMLVSRVIAVMSVFFYPILTESIGVPLTFLIQACINVGIFIVLWCTLVETTGVSLEKMHTVFA